MQFPDRQGALYTDPSTRSTHSAANAESVLQTMKIMGDVRLTWLTEEQEPLTELLGRLDADDSADNSADDINND